MSLGYSTPLCCNQVRLDSVGLGGVVAVTNPVDVHLKDINRGETRVLKQVVELQVGAEGGSLVVEGDVPDAGDVYAAHGCLRSTDITR